MLVAEVYSPARYTGPPQSPIPNPPRIIRCFHSEKIIWVFVLIQGQQKANIIIETKSHLAKAIVIGGITSAIARAITIFEAKKPGQIAKSDQASFFWSSLLKLSKKFMKNVQTKKVIFVIQLSYLKKLKIFASLTA